MDTLILSVYWLESARRSLATRLPVSASRAVRHEAFAFAGRGDRLHRLNDLLLSADAGEFWRGSAQQAYAASVSDQLPALRAAADRYDGYAAALVRYAAAVEEIEPELRRLQRKIADQATASASPDFEFIRRWW